MPRTSYSRKIGFKSWVTIPAAVNNTGSATTILGGSLAFDQAMTILRCRGHVQASMDPTKQVADTIACTFALGVASSDAVAVGAGSLPDPVENADYPWLWWGDMFLRCHKTLGEEAWGLTAQHMVVDTKAMRKMKPSESLFWVVQTATIAGAPNTFVDFGLTRVLIGT